MRNKCKINFKVVETSAGQAAVTEVVAARRGAAVLGGNEAGRFSAWGCEPVEVFEFDSNEENTFEKTMEDGPLDKLDEVLNKYSVDAKPEGLPEGMFCGGWIGYFGYEIGRYIEKIPCTTIDDLGMPLIRLAFYDKAIVYDSKERVWYLIAVEIDGDDAGEKLERLKGLMAEAQEVKGADVGEGTIEEVEPGEIKRNMTKEEYLAAIEKTRRYIYDGEVYQINFSHRFECEYPGRGVDLYHWQNKYNPSPYAALIDFDGYEIVSASPEMFVTINDGMISTKPIKGTRPRVLEGKDAERINKINFRELIESEKEQAELNMIIDLERNDLTRICEYGTIKVVQPRTIEEYPTVYHAVATIQGRLRGGTSFSDVLRGVFPGGSITGAPKVRAMEIIDELEPTCRGVYTGSIGFIGIDGCACLNIAIRTVIIKDKVAYAQAGGGIVADSDALAEWDETVTKVKALVAGIKRGCKKADSVKREA